MPGFRIVTNVGADQALKIVGKAARDLGFSVGITDDLSLSACKGSLALSLVAGIFSYCNFNIHVKEIDKDIVEVVIERNQPWWTGVIGMNSVKAKVKALADTTAQDLESAGGRILRKDEIS